jgi:hypothetical protein
MSENLELVRDFTNHKSSFEAAGLSPRFENEVR